MNGEQASFEGWARVEVMGHQTHIGFVRTEAYGAAVMFRVDVPDLAEREYILDRPQYVNSDWTLAGAKVVRGATKGHSVLVGAGSIYRIIPCDESAAMKAIEAEMRAEMKVISLPEGKALPPPVPRDFDCCNGNPEDGHEPGCETEGDEADQ
jgi:hypothetical protein